jgi:hypothetical protein
MNPREGETLPSIFGATDALVFDSRPTDRSIGNIGLSIGR